MAAPHTSADSVDRGLRLVRIFHPDPGEFGRLVAVGATDVPPEPRGLLDHNAHMTVAMERRHGGPVGLRVVGERSADACGAAGNWYAREILLVGPHGSVVQHGIVRIDLDAVGPAVAAAIRAGRIPLGRILLAAGLLLEVQRVALLAVDPGPHLRALLGGATGSVYGRVAEIVVNGRPAVELLEIVATP
jgi:chorismate-pyruvate lyase